MGITQEDTEPQITRLLTVPLLIVGAILLSGCEARHYEIVERACVEDGHKADYCRCMRKEMKTELGYQDFAVFSDLIDLGADGRIEPDSVLRIMEKHSLRPAKLAEIRQAIDRAGPIAEQRCVQ